LALCRAAFRSAWTSKKPLVQLFLSAIPASFASAVLQSSQSTEASRDSHAGFTPLKIAFARPRRGNLDVEFREFMRLMISRPLMNE
jgi:hypothetical protein